MLEEKYLPTYIYYFDYKKRTIFDFETFTKFKRYCVVFELCIIYIHSYIVYCLMV